MTAPSSPPLKTTTSGLDRRLVPYRLWEKAKALGTWDPAAIDFSGDAADWVGLDDREQDLLLRLTAQFEGGEESVTRHLLPLLQRVAAEGRIEEEMFLTSYLWEEAKHVEGFDRCLREIIEVEGELDAYFTAPYRQLVLEALPAAMDQLRTDDRPEALARASVTYQMIVEGVLAETGYSAYHTVLHEQGLMPGMQTFIQKVQRDESRHVAYGVFLLSRLVAEHGDAVWAVIEERMDALLPLVLSHIQETLAVYAEPLPFGVTIDQFIEIGSTQFEKRLARIERARTQSLDEVLYGSAGEASADSDGDRSLGARPVQPPDDRE
jgi:ribonucleoside-diphosphate reductase beta chain